MEKTYKLGKQIRALREAFGETQLELAAALGYDSPTTISMYENGWRGRDKYDMVSKIAMHYRISEEALLHRDFEAAGYMDLMIDDSEKLRQAISRILPVHQSKSALGDEEFLKTWKRNKQAADTIVRSMQFREQDFQICMEGYRNTFDSKKIPEAAANILWWITVYGLFQCYPRIPEGLRKLGKGQITKRGFFKDYFLISNTDVDESKREQDSSSGRMAFQTRFISEADELLEWLYMIPEGYKIADYYAVCLLRFGLSGSHSSVAALSETGAEMMRILARIGNPYATEYLAAVRELHKV